MHRRQKSSSTTILEEEGGDVSFPQRRRTPSFSSSLLDAITRSLDQDHPPNNNNADSNFTHTPKHANFSCNNNGNRERMNLRRSLMMEDWMEKQRSKSPASHFTKSSSSSSECSSGEPFSNFSSSETDTTTTTHNSSKKKKQRSRPKSEKSQKPPKQLRDCGFAKTTKLRALKIYGELNQRVRQPISPGSRIAAFLSSIFNSQNVKKAKMCYVGAAEDVSFERQKSKSPCFSSSSVSSFSMRSCMTKTPSSSSTKGNKSNNGVKRSVRFYPVSVILGEDSPPRDPALFSMPSFQKVSRSSSSTKEMTNNVVVAKENGKLKFRGFYGGDGEELDEDEDEDDDDEEEEEDDDEDALSCSSSDLFELDHLVNGGGGRYQQELPVYETTNLERNKAIANGLRL